MRNEEEVTKTGFSKWFACCGHWTVCDLGKGQCHYEKIDPEVQRCCSAWVRNHVNVKVETIIASPSSDDDLLETNEIELEQLSLF